MYLDRNFSAKTSNLVGNYGTSSEVLHLQTTPTASNYLDATSGVFTLSYNYELDKMTLGLGFQSISQSDFRKVMGDNIYLGFLGYIAWDKTIDDIPTDLQLSASFSAFEYNDFDPQLVNMTLYDGKSNTVVTPNAVVAPGTVLRVESVIDVYKRQPPRPPARSAWE